MSKDDDSIIERRLPPRRALRDRIGDLVEGLEMLLPLCDEVAAGENGSYTSEEDRIEASSFLAACRFDYQLWRELRLARLRAAELENPS
jgi:hypothetical protein